jgi:hypothetical protein
VTLEVSTTPWNSAVAISYLRYVTGLRRLLARRVRPRRNVGRPAARNRSSKYAALRLTLNSTRLLAETPPPQPTSILDHIRATLADRFAQIMF